MAEDFAFHGETTSLVVGESQSSGPVSCAENTILLKQVVNDRLCCRLAQPENSRRKKTSGGGSGAMAEACLRAGRGFNEYEIGTPCAVSLD
jgi:hypothetical protein